MPPESYSPDYIAVEGVIGVGKTTFSEMLSHRINAELVREEVFENPFLVDFYRNRSRFALSCQLYFLISRFQQQQRLRERDLFAQRVVADYLFAKDSIFASVNLTERELALYNKIAPILSRDVARPDLVIYLQASTPILLERIRHRNLPFEKTVDMEYIQVLNKAYDYFFFHYVETPLLVVRTDEIDFVHNPEHFNDLINQIQRPLSGKKYYVPAANVSQL